jgi:hypothetical protein
MGAASLMSTLAANDAVCVNSGNPVGFAAPFSGKLSHVMSTCADKNRIEPPAQPTTGDPVVADQAPPEFGGRKGPEPTRYGDWELRGRCIDF